MKAFAIILMTLSLIVMAFSCYLLYRNNLVFRERTRLLEEVSNLAREDIEKGKNWEWRYKAFDTYSYKRMLWELFKFNWELHEFLS